MPSEIVNNVGDDNQEDKTNEVVNAISDSTNEDVIQSNERHQDESESEFGSELEPEPKNDILIQEADDFNQGTSQNNGDIKTAPTIEDPEAKTELDDHDKLEKQNDDSRSLFHRLKRLYFLTVQWFHRFFKKA